MNDYSAARPDPPEATYPSDLEALRRHPSLASLAAQGWRLEGVPSTSVAWTFLGALLATLLSFGAVVGALFVVTVGMGASPVVAALVSGRVRAARTLLRVGRVVLMAWLVACTALHPSAPAHPATVRSARAGSPAPVSTAPVSTAAVSTAPVSTAPAATATGAPWLSAAHWMP